MNAAGLFVSVLFDDAFFCAAAIIIFVLPAIALTKKSGTAAASIVLHLFAVKMQQCSFSSVSCLMPQLL